ncbi:hypothetical protein [Streptomyces sp. NPDC055013]
MFRVLLPGLLLRLLGFVELLKGALGEDVAVRLQHDRLRNALEHALHVIEEHPQVVRAVPASSTTMEQPHQISDSPDSDPARL